MRTAYVLTLALCVSYTTAQRLDSLLLEREGWVQEVGQAVETRYGAWVAGGKSFDDCPRSNTCGGELPDTATCDPNYGSTKGCDCADTDGGRLLDLANAVIKESPKVTEDLIDVQYASCYTQGVDMMMRDIHGRSEGSVKWLHYGTTEGAYLNYPGFLWPRSCGGTECGETYDPRSRPWYSQGATGTKNVVIIFDTSGSMQNEGRMNAAKKASHAIIDSLVHTDTVALVSFSSTAVRENNYLVQATRAYRSSLKVAVDRLEPGGGTNYNEGLRKAFDTVDQSRGAFGSLPYDPGCSTVYLFLTDGEPSYAENENLQTTIDLINGRNDPSEHFFFFGLGDGVNADLLSTLSCDTGAVFKQAGDGNALYLARVMNSYYETLAAMRARAKVETVSWSEPYYSIPNIWGPLTSAVTPVYDKSREPWRFLGVAAADIPVCHLESAVTGTELLSVGNSTENTVQGCTCESTYQYQGKSFDGCTGYHWNTEWCATTVGSNCGVCDNSVSVDGRTTCWDECRPTGAAAFVAEKLNNATQDDCSLYTPLSDCAMELLREEHTCNGRQKNSGGQHSMAGCDEAVDGWKPMIVYNTQDDARWRKPLEDVRNSNSAYDGGQPCDSCPTVMFPSCTIEQCQEGLANTSEKDTETCDTDDAAIEIGAIVGIGISAIASVGICVGCCLLVRGRWQRAPQPPQHHQQPMYGQQPPAYGQPVYGQQHPMQYGQQPPMQYGQQPPQHANAPGEVPRF